MKYLLLAVLALLVFVALPGASLARQRGKPGDLKRWQPPTGSRSFTRRTPRAPYASDLRAELVRCGAEKVAPGAIYSHQIKSPEHRRQWATQYRQKGASMLGKWLAAGSYPGIWTMEGSGAWYGDHGGKPVQIKLRQGALFVDLEDPGQKRIYEKWQQQSRVKENDPGDLFQRLKDAGGTPLAKKVPGIRAPTKGRFLQELNIAGVVWYDTYGRRCPVLLNPDAIESVSF